MNHNQNKLRQLSIGTKLQHAGEEFRVGRGLVGATESSVTFATKSASDYPVYARLGNTMNHLELEAALGALHGGEGAVAFGSGMAALTTILLALLKRGDHVLIQANCYGGTQQNVSRLLPKLGVSFDFATIDEWDTKRQPHTKMCLFESITNPFCLPQRVKSLGAWAKKQDIIAVCDNTFAGPILCQPLMWGVDVVLESATKYLNGHSDVVAGAVVGTARLVDQVRDLGKFTGGFLPAQSCVQLLRGMRTLELRMARHCANGAAFAAALRSSPFVEKVFYGCAPEDQGSHMHSEMQEVFKGQFGGMCTVRWRPEVHVENMLKALTLVRDVPSLAGTETTVTLPLYTTNRWNNEAELRSLGINNKLTRFSLGLEHSDDIIADVLGAAAENAENIEKSP